jgi:hypothetical protein
MSYEVWGEEDVYLVVTWDEIREHANAVLGRTLSAHEWDRLYDRLLTEPPDDLSGFWAQLTEALREWEPELLAGSEIA